MSDFRIDQITNQAGTAGPQIAGITTFSGSSGLVMPSGPTEYRGGRGRAIFTSGYTPSSTSGIDIITISTLGNAVSFGNMSRILAQQSGTSNSTRGVYAGSIPSTQELIIFSSGGSTSFFGDGSNNMSVSRRGTGSCSSQIRGFFAGGQGQSPSPSPTGKDVIDFVIFNSLGNFTDFGDLTHQRRQLAGLSSPTRGVFGGGYNGDTSPYIRYDTMDYISLSNLGNAIDFGNLTIARGSFSGCSNSTRGLFAGGSTPSDTNVIDYISISTLGNAIDFGDLLGGSSFHNNGASTTQVRAVFGGGYGPTNTNVISYVTIATTGDSVDFGDLTFGRAIGNDGGISDAHGGLGD